MLDGLLSRLDGAFLLAGFLPFVLILLRRAREERTLAEAPAPRGRLLGRLALGVGGLVVGAELLVFGTERIVGSLGVSETAFGLLAVGAAVSFEEVILELLPAYRGRPEISVGNAIGTLVFLLTASLGAISLARPVPVPDAVRTYHAPALALAVILLCSLLARGRLGLAEGMLLCAAYAVYVVGAVTIA